MPTLDFKGKPFVYSHHLSVPFRELKIDAGKSLPSESGPSLDDNLIIHGDNLHALKALLPKYAGKVDVIYIDPPYNTGNEGWAYNDNVNSPLMKEWLGKVVDGEDLERHDKWLCMMWPRLVLLRELLSATGSIWITLDDNEIHNLRLIMDEIFGAENFVADICWQKMDSPSRNEKGRAFSNYHDHLLAYSNDESLVNLAQQIREDLASAYPLTLADGRKARRRQLRKNGKSAKRIDRPTMWYPLEAPDGTIVYPIAPEGWEGRWAAGLKEWKRLEGIGRTEWIKRDYGWVPYTIEILKDEPTAPWKTIWDDVSQSRQAKDLLKQIIGDEADKHTPKPPELVERIIEISGSENSIILDSFAGSGTTGHAVTNFNKKNGGNRKFILVELEEYADTITAERVRRVMKGVPNAKDEALKNGLGGSFTYCDLGDPIDMDGFFGDSASMPAYDQLASYIAYTATGEALGKAPKKAAKDWFIGEVGGVRLHLIYKADGDFMKSHDAALDMETVKTIAAGNKTGKPSYVFAAAKYMGQTELTRDYDMTFCQLPYAIHRIMGDGVEA